jgi:hypothetical protein
VSERKRERTIEREGGGERERESDIERLHSTIIKAKK